MKTKIFIIFLSINSLLGFAVSAQEKNAAQRIEVTVDPRFELLYIVQYLSGNLDPLPTPSTYLKEVDAYFAPYKNHPAVLKLKSFISSEKDNNYIKNTQWGLYFSDFPDFKFSGEILEEDTFNWYKEDFGDIAIFLKLCEDFAKDSGFYSFYQAHQKNYNAWAMPVRASLLRYNPVPLIEEFYGDTSQKTWRLLLTPLNNYAYWAIATGLPYNQKNISYQAGYFNPAGRYDKEPVFCRKGSDLYLYLSWHEGSHVYAHQLKLWEPYLQRIIAAKSLYEKDKIHDWEWRNWLEENLVRAIAAHLHSLYYGKKTGKKSVKREVGQGFTLVPAIYELLKVYRSHRDVYPTFQDFFPQVVDLI